MRFSLQCDFSRLRFNFRTSIADMQGHSTSPLVMGAQNENRNHDVRLCRHHDRPTLRIEYLQAKACEMAETTASGNNRLVVYRRQATREKPRAADMPVVSKAHGVQFHIVMLLLPERGNTVIFLSWPSSTASCERWALGYSGKCNITIHHMEDGKKTITTTITRLAIDGNCLANPAIVLPVVVAVAPQAKPVGLLSSPFGNTSRGHSGTDLIGTNA
jgi:hypothetical protein